MKTLEQLYNWFFLDTTCENTKIANSNKFLRVAPIEKLDHYKEIEIEESNFAFAEKDENWEIQYYHGLKKFLRIEKSDLPPIFIFDNHNHAIIFRYYIKNTNKLNNMSLIHIDQHSDCRENKHILQLNKRVNELDKIFKFWNEKCNVGNFIPPAIECWIINEQTQVRSLTSLKNLKIDKQQNYILDIDLDFCLDWTKVDKVDLESVILLKNKFDEIWKYTSWITIATSPYFLNQKLAKNILDTIFHFS
jgi:hypothetical protein